MTYKDITVKQMLLLKNLQTQEDELLNTIEILSILYDEDITELPINDVRQMLKSIDLTKQEVEIKDKYIINGRKYKVDLNMNISTAQYIDYTEFKKNEDIVKLISVFLIPDGHVYNDGYNLFEVYDDINEMKWVDAEAIAFFFFKRLIVFVKIFRNCLVKQLKKETNQLKKMEAEALIQVLETFSNSVSSPLCFPTAK